MAALEGRADLSGEKVGQSGRRSKAVELAVPNLLLCLQTRHQKIFVKESLYSKLDKVKMANE